jgi:hypothetical protein
VDRWRCTRETDEDFLDWSVDVNGPRSWKTRLSKQSGVRLKRALFQGRTVSH